MKVCGHCKKPLRLEDFSRDSSKRDGHSSNCRACRYAYMKSYYQDNKATWNLLRTSTGYGKSQRDYYQRNRQRIRAQQKTYHATYKKSPLKIKEWRIANPEKVAAQIGRRRCGEARAIPLWANEFFIGEIYSLAKLRTKMLGFVWHVDHVVPIQSDRVCGLHVENNLRVIPALENRRKGNRMWPEMAMEVA